MVSKRQSFQDIVTARQQKKLREDFIGRADELSRFARNLELAPEERALIFSISGQAGMGKTYLTQCFRQMVDGSDGLSAWTDDSQQSVIEAMAQLAMELQKKGIAMKSFMERHARYEERQRELLSAADAPKELPTFLERTLRVGAKLGRHVPTVGPVFQLLDDDAVSLISDAGRYIARRFKGSQEDVLLLHQPLETLTPLFLEGLDEVPESRQLAFFFDTYESTSAHLDAWLRELLTGAYGEVPSNVLLSIAGRFELEREPWAPYESVISRIHLNPFTREEVRLYLQQLGITQEALFEEIYAESHGLPMMVAFMAASKPSGGAPQVRPGGTAVQRFLKWTKDPVQRQVAMDAALPRWLNKDTLGALLDSSEPGPLFEWLKSMPFFSNRGEEAGWEYHGLVRKLMLQHVHEESPAHWSRIHQRLSQHYVRLREGRQLLEGVRQQDEAWRRYALEALYHEVCEGTAAGQAAALNGFVAALKTERGFAISWAETLKQAEEDSEHPLADRYGEALVKSLRDIEESRYLDATRAFTLLIERNDLEPRWRAAVLDWRGYLFMLADRDKEALHDLEAAVELKPDEPEFLTDLGRALFSDEKYPEAISALTRSLQVKPGQTMALTLRALAHHWLGEHAQALGDYTQALETKPDEPELLYMQRGMLYLHQRDYSQALRDFDAAIAAEPERADFLMMPLGVYLGQADYANAARIAAEMALKAEDVARRFADYSPRKLPSRAREEIQEIMRSVGSEPGKSWPFIEQLFEASARDVQEGARLVRAMAHTLIALDHYFSERLEDARAAVDEAVRLAPSMAMNWLGRGAIYSDAGLHAEALISFERAEALDPELVNTILDQRGLLFLRLGRYDEAVTCLTQALQLEPEELPLLYNLAVATACRDGIDGAQDVMRRAQAALQASLETDSRPQAIYGLGGLLALGGRPDEALQYLHDAGALDPEMLRMARHDPAWKGLHGDLRFQSLVALLH